MFRTLLIDFYLRIYQYYNLLWKIFFSCVNNVKLVYLIDNNKPKNISINYYSGLKMDGKQSGNFYLKIYNSYGTNHIAFDGDIESVSKVRIIESLENPPKRKNVILSNNDNPLDINLEILDNYISNIKYFPNQSIVNLGSVLKILGFECTHVTIIETKPFNKTKVNVNDIDINYIYY